MQFCVFLCLVLMCRVVQLNFIIFIAVLLNVSFSSVQFHEVSMHLEKPRYLPSYVPEVSPSVVFRTVPVFACLTMALSHPFKEYRQALPLSTPLSSQQPMVGCPWLCACKWCLKVLRFSGFPRGEPDFPIFRDEANGDGCCSCQSWSFP